MSKSFESIKAGLNEAIAYASNQCHDAITHTIPPVDIKNIRSKTRMSQTEFAKTFGISVNTLRHWEQGNRYPHGTALVLLKIIDHEPEAVLRALSSG